MRVFVAGGSGAIGIPLVRALVAAGHEVTALTRSPGRQDEIRALGAALVVADALNRDALMAALASARPTHVVHQLTALPKGGPRRASDLEPTNRLRIDGTRNLLEASIAVGAERFVAGSFAPLTAAQSPSIRSDDRAAAALRSMESQVLAATENGSIEGVILRYGLFYGLDTPSTTEMVQLVRKRRLPLVRGDAGLLPVIHVDDAVAATVLALESAPAGSIYNIVDDKPVSFAEIVQTIAQYSGSPTPRRVPAWLPRLIAPYMARITSIRMPLSNAQAKAELGWRLRYPTMRDGLGAILDRAA